MRFFRFYTDWVDPILPRSQKKPPKSTEKGVFLGIEVKYKALKGDKVPVSLRSFIDRYNPEKAYIVNLDLSKTSRINKTTLVFMPFYELLRQTAVL